MRSVMLLFVLVPLFAQAADTLRFQSAAFGTERRVIIHTPDFFRVASPEVRMPVFIVLDGQHEWFIEPLLNDIRYLQYTHDVPQAITVVVPHADRVAECAQKSETSDPLPLLRMLTEELPGLLEPYHPGDYRVLIGHSFTASFALYAKQRAPDAFDAVIALSPLHRVQHVLPALADQLKDRPNDDVLLAIGGAHAFKDGGHYARFMDTWTAMPAERGRMILTEYPSAGHTSIPIIAFPEKLATLFNDFSIRDSLAAVDAEYLLREEPPPPADLMAQIDGSLGFRGTRLPWELAEINGLASRLWASDKKEHVLAIYRRGAELYPGDYSMHWSLGEVLLVQDRSAGMAALRKAQVLLDSEPMSDVDRKGVKAEIEGLLK